MSKDNPEDIKYMEGMLMNNRVKIGGSHKQNMYFLHNNQIRCYLLTLYSLICPRSPLSQKFDTQKINISSLSHYKANRIRTQHLEVFDSSQRILIPKQCLAEGNSSLYFYNIR